MNQVFPVTGNKYNRTIKGILATFLIITGVSFVVVASKPNFIYPLPKSTASTEVINDVTPEVLLNSIFDKPYLMTVLRKNGSFSFAKIENAAVSNEKFLNEVELTYQNGDAGLVTEVNGTVNVFISKKGSKESAQLVQRGATTVTLPDSTLLPVKLVTGKIVRGKLTGNFELQTLTTNK